MAKLPSSTLTSESSSLNHCLVLYATQSGRAKACARRTVRILREQQGASVSTSSSVDDFVGDDLQNLGSNDRLLILFISTTGDGEQTDGIQQTWKLLLQKSLPLNLFQGTCFAIFCLGDRAYGEQFCAAGRKLAVRLLQLGATTVCDVGYGDDGTPDGGVFRDLDCWIQEKLLPVTSSLLEQSTTLGNDSQAPEPAYRLSISGSAKSLSYQPAQEWQQLEYKKPYHAYMESLCPMSAYCYDSTDGCAWPQRIAARLSTRRLLLGRVTTNTRITDGDWEQNTRHLRLEVSMYDPGCATSSSLQDRTSASWEERLPYRSGDVAVLLPVNPQSEVNRFLNVLPDCIRELADREIVLNSTKDSSLPAWPVRCTLRGWLTLCADLHSLPERESLRALSRYCDISHPRGKDQQEKLVSLSEPDQAALYADYILREKRSWTDVIYDFDSLQSFGSLLTLESLFTLLEPMRPREFSIASSPTKECLNTQPQGKGSFGVELCVAVVEGTTPLGRSYHGLCSHYIASLTDNDCVRLWIRPGSFHGLPLPSRSEPFRPILCVGAGTGIAPLRALIQERASLRSMRHCVLNEGQHDILLFGCRKEGSDFYYRDEWKRLCDSKELSILTAFSQDQRYKIYVQQILQKADHEDGLLHKHLFDMDGAVYIAGGPKMARAVKDTILDSIARTMMDNDAFRAKHFVASLQRSGRFAIEAWS